MKKEENITAWDSLPWWIKTSLFIILGIPTIILASIIGFIALTIISGLILGILRSIIGI